MKLTFKKAAEIANQIFETQVKLYYWQAQLIELNQEAIRGQDLETRYDMEKVMKTVDMLRLAENTTLILRKKLTDLEQARNISAYTIFYELESPYKLSGGRLSRRTARLRRGRSARPRSKAVS